MPDDLIKEARDALNASYDADRENRNEAVADLRFVAGFQWDDTAKAERNGRPMITINRSGQFIRQVANPIRQNMPTIKVEPDRDEESDMAEIANGLLRRIQYNSSASHVYANAVEHMVACGIGWFRAATDYASASSFDQEITIKRVFNPLSVYPDPAAMEPDRSDMGWCVVSEMWPVATFKKKWPGKAVRGMDTPANGTTATGLSWGDQDKIRVAEFWRVSSKTKRMVQLATGETVDYELVKKVDPALAEQMARFIVNERSIEVPSVSMALVSGAEQLEETYECPCRWIPLIPVIGAEIPLEQGTYRHGLIRFQREPQQLHNYFMSVAAETLGQQPKSPFAVLFKAIENYKSVWDNANRVPTPYLPYDAVPGAPNGGKPERMAPPPLPQGLIAMAQMLADDMKATTGIYDAALGNRSNETSGVAIGARIQQGDQATFHFTDNLEHGLEHLGRILLDMIPKVYDTERTLRLRAADDTEKTVTINKSLGSYDGQEMVHNDISKMSFSSVRVVLGPSFESRRQQAVLQLTQLIQAVPAIGALGGDIIVRNMDFDGADELADRLKAVLPPPVLQVMNSGEPGQPPPPDPMQQAQEQAAVQMLGHQVDKSAAETEQARQQALQAHAQTQEQTARVEGAALDNALKEKKLREPPPQRSAGRPDQSYASRQ